MSTALQERVHKLHTENLNGSQFQSFIYLNPDQSSFFAANNIYLGIGDGGGYIPLDVIGPAENFSVDSLVINLYDQKSIFDGGTVSDHIAVPLSDSISPAERKHHMELGFTMQIGYGSKENYFCHLSKGTLGKLKEEGYLPNQTMFLTALRYGIAPREISSKPNSGILSERRIHIHKKLYADLAELAWRLEMNIVLLTDKNLFFGQLHGPAETMLFPLPRNNVTKEIIKQSAQDLVVGYRYMK